MHVCASSSTLLKQSRRDAKRHLASISRLLLLSAWLGNKICVHGCKSSAAQLTQASEITRGVRTLPSLSFPWQLISIASIASSWISDVHALWREKHLSQLARHCSAWLSRLAKHALQLIEQPLIVGNYMSRTANSEVVTERCEKHTCPHQPDEHTSESPTADEDDMP